MRVLLDEQEIVRPSFRSCASRAEISLDEDGAETHGRLVEDEQRGSAMSARPIASICCCPPLNAPASLPLNSVQDGKQLVDTLEARLELAVPALTVRPEHQVLPHREPREDVSAFRHVPDAEVDDPVRLRLVEPRAVERDRIRFELDQPHHRTKRRGLPRSVRADDAEPRTRRDVEAEVLDGVDMAVRHVEAADREKRLRSRDLVGPRRRCDRLDAHARLACTFCDEPLPR